VKLIRPELSTDDGFRSRFRSEVTRARQVPPFCTAEVLDADPDHHTPYLVAEYVDGPSLADLVQDNGPLTGGALHGAALGVATALAAIHGSGVVHRDLKPANVLFAPGTLKVIDFGIAKAVEATSEHTLPGQLLGTIAYMAPERFDADTARHVGPAADVFAWGVLVAYAATGRTPFAADSPMATAGRIVTQPPDLTGLTGPLHDLVARAVEKDPAQRPSAHDLVTLLLSAGAQGNRAVNAGLDQRPEIRHAAEAVRDAAGHRGRHGIPTDPSTPDLATTVAETPRRPATVTRRRLLAAGTALVLIGALVAPARALITAVADEPHTVSPQTGADSAIVDRFDQKDRWRASRSDTRGSCTGGGSLIVTSRPAGTLHCAGSDIRFGDQSIDVDVRLTQPGVCAAIWTRFIVDTGYRITLCTDQATLDTDYNGDLQPGTLARLDTVNLRQWRHVEIRIQGAAMTVTVDDTPTINHRITATRLPRGHVVLGLVNDDRVRTLPAEAQVAFANLEIHAL
jgi:hypothetical protein